MRHMRAINAAQMTEGGGFRNDPPALSIRTEWFENNTGEQLLAFQVQKGSLFQRGVGHLSARRPVLPSSRRPEVRRRSTLEACFAVGSLCSGSADRDRPSSSVRDGKRTIGAAHTRLHAAQITKPIHQAPIQRGSLRLRPGSAKRRTAY